MSDDTKQPMCPHDMSEQNVARAMADRVCPLCLHARITELESSLTSALKERNVLMAEMEMVQDAWTKVRNGLNTRTANYSQCCHEDPPIPCIDNLTDRAEDAEAALTSALQERDEARKAKTALHRRAQAAEGEVLKLRAQVEAKPVQPWASPERQAEAIDRDDAANTIEVVELRRALTSARDEIRTLRERRFHAGPTIDLERDIAADEECHADAKAGGWWITKRDGRG